jgi:DnaJ family protein C protein 2
MTSSPILLLEPPPASWQLGHAPVILRSPSKPSGKAVEQAGRAYHERLLSKLGQQLVLTDQRADESKAVSSDSNGGSNGNGEAKEDIASMLEVTPARAKYLARNDIDLKNYYQLLDLTLDQIEADESCVRTAYRKVSLLCHPDKAPTERRAFAETRFKAMQLAHETLGDTTRRRAYESSLDFDDSVPEDDEGLKEAFFKVYGPVFARNAKFSGVQPVPLLGGSDVPFEQVDAFYDFWLSFKSWRDFAFQDEHDVGKADSRDEKRWMERENAKKRVGKKKEEASRVRKFVEDAMRKDPRIKQKKASDEAAKQAKKDAKAAEKQAVIDKKLQEEEEEKRKEGEEKKKAEEEKKKRQAAAVLLKKNRQKLRKTCKEPPFAAVTTEDDVELLCAKLEHEQLKTLLLKVSLKADAQPSETEAALAAMAAEVQKLKDVERAEKVAVQQRSVEMKFEERRAVEERRGSDNWTLDELSQLAKAMQKYPVGVSRRYDLVTQMVNVVATNRTVKEIIQKSKELSVGVANKVAPTDAFDAYKTSVQYKKSVAESESHTMADSVRDIGDVRGPTPVPATPTPEPSASPSPSPSPAPSASPAPSTDSAPSPSPAAGQAPSSRKKRETPPPPAAFEPAPAILPTPTPAVVAIKAPKPKKAKAKKPQATPAPSVQAAAPAPAPAAAAAPAPAAKQAPGTSAAKAPVATVTAKPAAAAAPPAKAAATATATAAATAASSAAWGKSSTTKPATTATATATAAPSTKATTKASQPATAAATSSKPTPTSKPQPTAAAAAGKATVATPASAKPSASTTASAASFANAAKTSASASAKPAAAPLVVVVNGKPNKPAAATAPAHAPAVPINVSVASDKEWSADEQFAFEEALRTVPKEEGERWVKIAALVKTKTKKQCVDRFKEIRQSIFNKKPI